MKKLKLYKQDKGYEEAWQIINDLYTRLQKAEKKLQAIRDIVVSPKKKKKKGSKT